MQTAPSSATSAPTTEATVRPVAREAEARAQLNVSIVQASYEVSLTSQNDSLSVLFKTAIDNLNEVLKPEFGENAIQNAMSQDNSPEGTAGRIVSLSTGFLEAFKQNHAGEDEADVLRVFMDTIRGGFEKGFKEASDMLSGLNVLEGDVAAGIAKTYELVLQGYADFEAAQTAKLNPAVQTPE